MKKKKSKRWNQIEKLYNSVLNLETSRRESFLSSACRGDESLRKEVEQLLEYRKEAEHFIETPAIEILGQEIAADPKPWKKSNTMVGKKVTHYHITEKIGSGGMGVVYKAKDNKLNRFVALKFLPEELMQDKVLRQRLRREAQATSALNHPNICTIYDIDESEGRTFIAMELLEGQTLKQLMEKSRLKTEEISDIAVQILNALVAAQAKSIIHRDIKPANIFITQGGQVKILDFGLAKLADSQLESVATTLSNGQYLTNPGSAVGTIAYMSPEQARGEELDGRSDLFSFGVVLYEMATGRPAFTGNTTAVIFNAILTKTPLSPAILNPNIPNGLDHIINKTMEKDRKIRYQSASDLLTDLNRLSIGGDSDRIAVSSISEPSGIKSLAVIPFANMSSDKEQEYFGDGLAEEIINALTRLPDLRVAARTSSFSFRDEKVDVREIGAKLNVENILEGSVRKSGNRIRVTTQLISVSNGYHLWSERYDREMTDIFDIQDEICRAIVEKLRIQLTAGHQLVKRHTENLEAYNLCLKASYHLSKGVPESVAKSREYYEQAIALDPKYALAWYGLAYFYYILGFLGYMPTKAAYAESNRAAEKILELDETLPEAYALIGMFRASNYQWKEAELEFHHALELNPKSEGAWVLYDYYCLVPLGRLDEAVAASEKAAELDPLSPFLQWRLGYRYYLARQWDRAIKQCCNALELDPTYIFAHCHLGLSHLQKGEHDEAIRTIETAVQLAGRGPFLLGALGAIYAKAGRIEEARKILMELEDLNQKTYVQPSSFPWICSELGEMDKAFDWWEKAVDEHEGLIIHFHLDPTYDLLHAHPRYPAILRRMKLDP
ncbi:MAG: protein kinase [Acidobacteria bacterium]|nr:protein kinase [Acidobacteriota bacterium]